MLQRMDSRSLPMMEKNLSILIIMPVMRSKKRYLSDAMSESYLKEKMSC